MGNSTGNLCFLIVLWATTICCPSQVYMNPVDRSTSYEGAAVQSAVLHASLAAPGAVLLGPATFTALANDSHGLAAIGALAVHAGAGKTVLTGHACAWCM